MSENGSSQGNRGNRNGVVLGNARDRRGNIRTGEGADKVLSHLKRLGQEETRAERRGQSSPERVGQSDAATEAALVGKPKNLRRNGAVRHAEGRPRARENRELPEGGSIETARPAQVVASGKAKMVTISKAGDGKAAAKTDRAEAAKPSRGLDQRSRGSDRGL